MQQLMDLSNEYKQSFKFQIDGGDLMEIDMWFVPNQIGWFFNIKYGDFMSNGLHLVNSPNVLDPYFNILRFGLACVVDDGQEPYFVDDFITGRVKLYVLSEEECKQIQESYK